jgi:hypothetical protein
VLLDETGRVLLARFEYGGKAWWVAPGGGLEFAETHEEAAQREIGEETGLWTSGTSDRISGPESTSSASGSDSTGRRSVISSPRFPPSNLIHNTSAPMNLV